MSTATAPPGRRAARPPRPMSFFDSVSNARRAVDTGVLGALFLLGTAGFHTVYGGVQHLVTGVMGLVLGTLLALIGARWRWGPLRLVPALLGIHLLLGPMFAAPNRALWGVLPTPSALWEVLQAPVTTWKSVLTMAPPVGTAQGVLGVVWLSTLLLSLLGMSLVLRTRFFVLAWLFPLALVGVTIAFGTNAALAPVLRGVPYAVLSMAWLTWRYEGDRLTRARSTIISDTVRPGSWQNPVLRRRVIGGSLILLLAGGGAAAAAPLLEPPSGTIRYAVRDHIAPPFDPTQYVSPLTEFRGYLKDQRTAELFTLSGVSGGEQVRLATMDLYDLHVYNVAGGQDKDSPSGAFLRTAPGVDLHPGSGEERTAQVTIGAYTGVWLPTLGARTDRIDVDSMTADRAATFSENLYLNQKSQTAVNASGVQIGDVYDLTYIPYTEPGEEELKTARFDDIALPEGPVVDTFAQYAKEWMGEKGSDYENFQELTRNVKDDAFYSHGLDDEAASLSGHGVSRLLAMLEDYGFDEGSPDAQPLGRIGDEEQYAALTAALARSIGIPARVVMGFEVPAGAEGTVAVTGNDVTAWVEVAFEGIGWVRINPTPDDDEDPVKQTEELVDEPMPQVAQPPPPPAEPPTPPPGATSEDAKKEEPPEPAPLGWYVYAGIAVTPLLLVTLAALAVLLAKRVRRGRRRTRGSLPARFDGGWQEILDQLTDMGRRPDPLRTRAETAALLQAEIPTSGAVGLAGMADRAVFGPDDLPEAAAEEYWGAVMAARRGMAESLPWHRRLRAAISLKSFRRASAERRAEKRREKARRRARKKAERRANALRRTRAGSRRSRTTKTSSRASRTKGRG